MGDDDAEDAFGDAAFGDAPFGPKPEVTQPLLPPAPADRTVIVLGDRIVEIPNSPRSVEV